MTFHPLLWDEIGAPHAKLVEHTDDEILTQVWFAGVHANVGGGYPDDGLSYIPLRWMIEESRKKGVIFNKHAIEDVAASATPFGRLYDSRAGFGAYYRYQPRRLDPSTDSQGAKIAHPKIHESVIWRMAVGTDAYAPLSLPPNMRIVADLSERRQSKANQAGSSPPRTPNVYSLASYQQAIQSDNRMFGVTGNKKLDEQTIQRTASDIGSLQTPDARSLELVWDTVWWRRIAYFTTLAATALLLLFPYLPSPQLPVSIAEVLAQYPGFTIVYRALLAFSNVLRPPLDFIIGSASSLLPSFTKPALDAYRGAPWTLVGLGLLVAALLFWGALIDRRIHDRALAAWNVRWRAGRHI